MSEQMQSDISNPTEWQRCSAIADYPGFNSYLEIRGARMRFVVDAKIEQVSEVPKLQEYIRLLGGVLALQELRMTVRDENSPAQTTGCEKDEKREAVWFEDACSLTRRHVPNADPWEVQEAGEYIVARLQQVWMHHV